MDANTIDDRTPAAVVYCHRPMNINYIPEHVWEKRVTDDPLSEMGKSNRARLRSTLKLVPESHITHSIEPLTDEIIEWFTPLYNTKISSKENPKLFDIRATTIGKDSPYKYNALILSEGGERIGATIFSERPSLLSIAYRIYPNEWREAKLQANPSLYTELLINEYAHAKGYTRLSHGRDRNPYGLNSHIGLAIFKLSIGCVPQIAKVPPPAETLDTEEASTDLLVFEAPTTERRITKGYLICTEAMREQYLQVTKYEEQVRIETIVRT